jgi:tetratricopeptide (TPR) repeat protein
MDTVMPIKRLGRSIPRIFAAFFLLACSVPAIRAQRNESAAPQSASANFETLAKSAAAAREAGRTEEAIRDYQRAVEFRPGWEEGWWYLGTMRYDSDQFAAAIPAFQKIVQLDPKLGPAWNLLGLCEFEARDFTNARAHLEKGQALGGADDPEISRVATYHLALLLIRGAEFERASTMLALAFGTVQMPAQIKLALGLALLRVPLLPEEIDPSRDALVHAAGETASAWAQNGPPKAIEEFQAMLKNYAGTPYLHYAYGVALASAKRDEEALDQQREEVKISPQSALPQIEISALELRLGRLEESLRAAEEAVRLAPDASAAHRALSQSLQALGKNEKAAEELKAAESLAPEKPHPDKRIAVWYVNHSPPAPAEPGESSRAAGKATNDTASGFEELSRRAAESQAAGNVDASIESYQQALRFRPEWDDGRWNLAMLYFSTAHYPEAIAALKYRVERKPDDGTAWAVMGLCDFEMKNYDNALIHLRRGQALGFGGSAESVRLAKYRLGILLERSGEFENAMELLAPEASKGPLAKEMQFVLGMALLRMARLPEDVEAEQKHLVETAGEIAVLLEASKYDEAFPKFQALLKEYPRAPFLHYAYGTARAALSQYQEAETRMREEIRISPASELPFVRLAGIALRQHRAADALPPAQRAVNLAPDSAEAHYVLGRTFLELGQNESAVRELETAEKFAPGSPEIHFNLAKAYAKAKRPEKAEQERATFVRLNALAEQQRSLHGNQSYEGPRDANDFSVTRAEPAKTTAPPH